MGGELSDLRIERPPFVPRRSAHGKVNWSMAATSVVLALAVAVVGGLAPAIRAGRLGLVEALCQV